MRQFPLSVAAGVAFVVGGAIKSKAVDHCADDDAASLADGVAKVFVVAPKPVRLRRRCPPPERRSAKTSAAPVAEPRSTKTVRPPGRSPRRRRAKRLPRPAIA
jgi:hypothetical protein